MPELSHTPPVSVNQCLIILSLNVVCVECGSLAVCSVLFVGCEGCLVGHVVSVGYRAQQCDLNPDLLRVLEDGYVSKCCEV